MARTFLQLQTELASLHLDTSAAWVAGGTSNKLAINDAYETVRDKLKNSQKVRPYIATAKTSITITNKVAALPANFDCINVVSTEDFDNESDVDMNDSRYHAYEVRGISGAKSLYIDDDGYGVLYISYVPLITTLSADGDIPSLPPELHRCIADFALFEYYRKTRENVEAANSLSLANSIINDKLASLS